MARLNERSETGTIFSRIDFVRRQSSVALTSPVRLKSKSDENISSAVVEH